MALLNHKSNSCICPVPFRYGKKKLDQAWLVASVNYSCGDDPAQTLAVEMIQLKHWLWR